MKQGRFSLIRDDKGNISHVETNLKGKELLRASKLNKGNAFTQEERHQFDLLGKLPHAVETLEEQVSRFYQLYLKMPNNLEKNIFLTELHDNNETLFYRLVSEHFEEMLPIIYTPTVGDAVENFSLQQRDYRGLFIAYPDKDRIETVLHNRLNTDVDLIVVTDGERILGIGDQGVGGVDICIAKLMVYTLAAGVNPHRVLPIQLDVGTNNEKLLSDPQYLGWRHPRISGKDYDDFIGAFVAAVQKTFPGIYLHWEDFGKDNARKNLDRFRKDMLTFNDDIQGTGAIALASILSATQAVGQSIADQRVVFFGAGTAGVGIADQVADAMVRSGITREEANQRIWLIDRPGLLLDTSEGTVDFQKPYLKTAKNIESWECETHNKPSFLDVIKNLKPTVLIGCSTVFGAFNETIVKTMAEGVDRPIILPLSNPTSKAEADPKDILAWTQGKAVIATGSPFAPVTYEDKTHYIAQSNNAYVFPGIGLGVIAVKANRMTDNMVWAACQAVVSCSPALKDSSAPILPPLSEVHQVSHAVAKAVAEQAIQDGVAKPVDDLELAIQQIKWTPKYYRLEHVE